MKPILSQHDFYTRQARADHYPARSVYKLQEIDKEFGLVKKGDKVLDLGAAPGSWLIFLSDRVGKSGKVVGIDMVDLPAVRQGLKIDLPCNAVFIKKDVLGGDLFALPELHEKYNLVVSDLAPHTTGVHFKDAADSLELSKRALEIAKNILEEGGHFVCKIFEGEGVVEFIKEVGKYFKIFKRFRPKAVRKGSKEFYLVAKNYES
ncbi:MAG: RlmE family RNA methyltransferase [Candidatus Pacebacteria bacterium]|nr:RlmE family RNA methyltransferase [Candidatus Paceibacterota bacterium]